MGKKTEKSKEMLRLNRTVGPLIAEPTPSGKAIVGRVSRKRASPCAVEGCKKMIQRTGKRATGYAFCEDHGKHS